MINYFINKLLKLKSKSAFDLLKDISAEVNQYSDQSNKKLRILYGPSFSIYPPCFIHDSILAEILKIKGADIIPIYCDGVQKTECNVYGGVWGGVDFSKNCKNCIRQSEKLWTIAGEKPVKLSKFITDKEKEDIDEITGNLSSGKWASFVYNRLPFGIWAKDILVNNYVVGDYHLISGYYRLGLAHIKNLLLLKYAYEKVLDIIKPDRVVSNDSYYGMWAVLQKLCERRKIPFYSHWISGRQNAWCYAYNDAAMNLDFSKPWKKFSKITLNERQRKKVEGWLKGRRKGKGMTLDTASLTKYKTEEFDLSRIDLRKQTALLTSNVIWDLAALNKQIIFSDMMDWIVQTIKWFEKHPQFQLIVKPHPAELHPSLPITRENVIDMLAKKNIIIPQNVILLTPKVKLTVYQLFPIIKVGLVHTSTVGYEMAASRIPVITSGRSPYRGFGFTIDAINKREYFYNLKSCLTGKISGVTNAQKYLAYKFILFYYFHYYIKIDIMNTDLWNVTKLKVKSIDDLLPGKNKYLDYISDSIISGLSIVSENRWPPES